MDKQAVGGRIEVLRKKHKLSQDGLAAKSGIARRALQMLEKGEGNPTVDTLSAIASVFKISFDELIAGEPTQAQVEWTLKEAGRFLAAVSEASAPRRALILALAYKNEKYLEELSTHPNMSQVVRGLTKVP